MRGDFTPHQPAPIQFTPEELDLLAITLADYKDAMVRAALDPEANEGEAAKAQHLWTRAELIQRKVRAA